MRRHPLPSPLRDWHLWLCGCCLGLPMLGWLLAYGPQYEPDVHYYLTGALHWHPLHPPGYNLWLSLCHRLWASAYLPIVLQQGVWLIAVITASRALLGRTGWAALACLLLGAEPTMAYLHLSLQSDSLFASCLLLGVAPLLRATETDGKALRTAALWLAFAGALRYAAWLCWPVWLLLALRQGARWRGAWQLSWPLLLAQVLIWGGHQWQGNGSFPGRAKLLWDNVAPLYQPGDCGTTAWCQPWDAAARAGAFAQWPPMARYVAGEAILRRQVQTLQASGLAPDSARNLLLDSLHRCASQLYASQPLGVHWRLLTDNLQVLAAGHFLDYRHWPPAHLPHMTREYAELDSLVQQLYGFAGPGPSAYLWQTPIALNRYMQGVGLLCLCMILGLLWRRSATTLNLLWLALLPICLMLVAFPIKTRFLLPLLPLLVLAMCVWLQQLWPRHGSTAR